MKTLFEPKSGLLSVPYQPDEGSKLLENPPRFTWMPGQLEDDRYMLQISTSPSYETGATTTISPIPYNLYTPDRPLEPGTYYWRYALLTGEQVEDTADLEHNRSSWSQSRMFHVPEGLPETPCLAERKGTNARIPVIRGYGWTKRGLRRSGKVSARMKITAAGRPFTRDRSFHG